jgi:hypothetical protein
MNGCVEGESECTGPLSSMAQQPSRRLEVLGSCLSHTSSALCASKQWRRKAVCILRSVWREFAWTVELVQWHASELQLHAAWGAACRGSVAVPELGLEHFTPSSDPYSPGQDVIRHWFLRRPLQCMNAKQVFNASTDKYGET